MAAKAKKSNKQLPSKKSTVSAVPSGSALRSGARDPNNDESGQSCHGTAGLQLENIILMYVWIVCRLK